MCPGVKPLIAQFQKEYAEYREDMKRNKTTVSQKDILAALEAARAANFREDPGFRG